MELLGVELSSEEMNNPYGCPSIQVRKGGNCRVREPIDNLKVPYCAKIVLNSLITETFLDKKCYKLKKK